MNENILHPSKTGDQRQQKIPHLRSNSTRIQKTKPLDIESPVRRAASQIFNSKSEHHGYSRSLPTPSTLQIRTPGAPIFKSRPTPNEDLIPPLSLPPASCFSRFGRSNQKENANDLHEFQYASSCPASIWHFEDRRSLSSTQNRFLSIDDDEEEIPERGPRKDSITALSILEGVSEGMAQLELGKESPREEFPVAEEDTKNLTQAEQDAEDIRNRFPSIEDPFVLDPVETDAMIVPDFTLT